MNVLAFLIIFAIAGHLIDMKTIKIHPIILFLFFIIIFSLSLLFQFNFDFNLNVLDFLNSNSDAITAISTFIIAIVAVYGIIGWKKQMKGVKEYEIAYNLHYSILKLRNAISHVRSISIWPSESYKAIKYAQTKYPDQKPEDIEKNYQPYVYEMRWEKITNVLTEVESYLLGAEVLWGNEILDLMEPLNIKITELKIALLEKVNPTLATRDLKQLSKIIYESGKDDTFNEDIKLAIQNIVEYINSKL